MPEEFAVLVEDLAEELVVLDAIVGESNLELMTVAEGWSIRDTVAHLMSSDEAVVLTLRDPDEFVRRRSERASVRAHGLGGSSNVAAPFSELDASELLGAWRARRLEVIEAFRAIDPASRIEWTGPSMSSRSFATSRIMEYWSHGEDIAHALGVPSRPTNRLRHVAHLGAITRNFSFVVHGYPEPSVPVFVDLKLPDDSRWTFGEERSEEFVRGDARDFCLVVTQRRHLEDTSLSVEGGTANTWMRIAQAFAGQPTLTSEARRGMS